MTRVPTYVGRLVAALLVSAAAGLVVVGAAPAAQAATCSTGSGVSVVVDFGSLGGGVQSGCVAAGGTASGQFGGAGFGLEYVAKEPGFVCRISGRPTPDQQGCADTPPDNAYWGLWWSDGTSGQWNWSNYGVGSLQVPDGGSVAFAWQNGGGRTAPGLAAPALAGTGSSGAQASAAPTAKPTKKPSTRPSSKPSAKPTRQPSAKPTQRPSATPSSTAVPSTSVLPTGSPSESPSESASASAPDAPSSAAPSASATIPTASAPAPVVPSPSEVLPSSAASEAPYDDAAPASATSDGALPAWVAPLVIVLLAGGAAVAFVVRRRARSTG
jgi:hypothetical protein